MAVQHFLARETGSGGRLDPRRPTGVGALPPGTDWQNYAYGVEGLYLVRMDAAPVVLSAYGALPDVLPFPSRLTDLVQSSQLGPIDVVCDQYLIPRHWISVGLEWGELLRRLFRVFSLVQRLRGVSKLGLATHLSGGETLTTQWRDLPQALRDGLLAAADSFAGLSGGMDRSGVAPGVTLGEVLYGAGRSWQREPWEVDAPSRPGTITDSFERASLGTDWTNGPGGWNNATIVSSSDLTVAADLADSLAYYSAVSWNAAQSSRGVLSAHVTDGFPGVACRCASDGDAYHWGPGSSTLAEAWLSLNGPSYSQLGASFSVGANGNTDSWKLDVNGTTLTCYKNDVSQGTRTDATLTSGSAGLVNYDTSSTWESWEGTGEVVAGGSFITPRRAGRRAMINW